ncbi:nucleotidyltransferase family protein [uncultured Winogradskyella sp.]|uniref:nucleotidyltransferase family protein n=1 Tax=uncultured Winogradskyella sp. TaxID=395353 RepID=UPI0026215F79|nr:nucleotidyltransferase family protein [uncultured Winogradskyella sp.]
MGNLAITYQHIADILSFETSNHKLEKTLSHPSFNWDHIVVEGSKHLVLPAIYCRLKAKKLLGLLPKELNSYLTEITSLNRNRNEAILKQVHSISQLLNQHQINYTFLKGSALIVQDIFEDIAERMIGDIDILVDIDQLDNAYHLLITNGYTPIEQTLGNDFFEHKHLPRLKPKHEICAVELHRKLFVSHSNTELKSKTILSKKINRSSVFIPSTEHLLMHNILNFQINDKGTLYNSISFRSAYDTIVLLQEYNHKKEWYNKWYNKWYNNKIFKRYFNYTSLFFNEIKIITNAKSNFFTSFYLFKLKHIKFYKFWNRLLKLTNFISVMLNRMSTFLLNKSYRKAIINDRKRIYIYFKSIFDNF